MPKGSTATGRLKVNNARYRVVSLSLNDDESVNVGISVHTARRPGDQGPGGGAIFGGAGGGPPLRVASIAEAPSLGAILDASFDVVNEE